MRFGQRHQARASFDETSSRRRVADLEVPPFSSGLKTWSIATGHEHFLMIVSSLPDAQ